MERAAPTPKKDELYPSDGVVQCTDGRPVAAQLCGMLCVCVCVCRTIGHIDAGTNMHHIIN